MPLCIYLCHKHLQRTYDLIRDGWIRADICRGNYTGWPLYESVRYWPSTVNYTLKFVTPYKAILVCWRCNVRWSSERAEKVVGRAQWNGTYSLGYYPNAIIGHTCTPAERGLFSIACKDDGWSWDHRPMSYCSLGIRSFNGDNWTTSRTDSGAQARAPGRSCNSTL